MCGYQLKLLSLKLTNLQTSAPGSNWPLITSSQLDCGQFPYFSTFKNSTSPQVYQLNLDPETDVSTAMCVAHWFLYYALLL